MKPWKSFKKGAIGWDYSPTAFAGFKSGEWRFRDLNPSLHISLPPKRSVSENLIRICSYSFWSDFGLHRKKACISAIPTKAIFSGRKPSEWRHCGIGKTLQVYPERERTRINQTPFLIGDVFPAYWMKEREESSMLHVKRDTGILHQSGGIRYGRTED